MIHGFNVSMSPIGGSWLLVLAAMASVVVLTFLAYSKRLRGTEGRWRWVAIALRMLALLLCLLAALRPTLVLQEKMKRDATVVCLVDTSTSMSIGDEVGGRSRFDVARETIKTAEEFAKTLGPDLKFQLYTFDSSINEPKEADLSVTAKPKGRETRIGAAILEAKKKQDNTSRRVARMVIISDFTSNGGPDPIEVAHQMSGREYRSRQSAWAPKTPGRSIATSRFATFSPAEPSLFITNWRCAAR